MEFRNLEAFLKVAELKHFTNAAEQLGYVQSTITSRIQQLEEELGTPLFERIGKKILLTPAGEELVIYANQIVGLCEEAKELGREDKSLGGNIKIGTVESLYTTHVWDFIHDFKKIFPRVTLTIRIGTGRDLLHLLGSNELDAVFMLDEHNIKSSFKQVFSVPTDIVFVTSSQNPLCQNQSLRLAEVLRAPLILTERHSLYRNSLAEVAEARNLSIIPSIELNNTSAIIQLLKDGMGISYLPSYSVQKSISKGKLSILRLQDVKPVKFLVQLVYHKGKWISRPLQMFLNMLTEHVTH